MNIVLEYHNPTQTHCGVAVSIDGRPVGNLVLEQRDLVTFQNIIMNGVHARFDTFMTKGDPTPPEQRKLKS